MHWQKKVYEDFRHFLKLIKISDVVLFRERQITCNEKTFSPGEFNKAGIILPK